MFFTTGHSGVGRSDDGWCHACSNRSSPAHDRAGDVDPWPHGDSRYFITDSNFNVEEPRPSQDWLAYRVDSQRVVMPTEMLYALTSETSDLIRPLAQLIPQVAVLPEGHEARSRFGWKFADGRGMDDCLERQLIRSNC
jgi:hypothetical protein